MSSETPLNCSCYSSTRWSTKHCIQNSKQYEKPRSSSVDHCYSTKTTRNKDETTPTTKWPKSDVDFDGTNRVKRFISGFLQLRDNSCSQTMVRIAPTQACRLGDSWHNTAKNVVSQGTFHKPDRLVCCCFPERAFWNSLPMSVCSLAFRSFSAATIFSS